MTGRRRGVRELVLLLGAGVVGLLLLEVGSALVYPRLSGRGFDEIRADLARLPAEGSPQLPAHGEPEPGYVTNKVLHPYLGYVLDYSPERRRINRFGFRGATPLQERDDDRVVVAVFGGSVAMHVQEGRLAEALQQIPELQGRTIRFVSAAMSGYKQPQQLMALTYLLSLGAEFDYVINLDGFNDVVLPFTENVPAGVHPSYPRLWHLFSRKGFDRGAIASFVEIEALRGARTRRQGRFARFPLRHSRFGLALWDVLDRRKESDLRRATARLNEKLAAAGGSYQATGPFEPYAVANDLLEDLVDLWQRSSRQMAGLCGANGIRYFHFLQPNPFVPDSKIFTEEERRLVFDGEPSSYPELVERAYPALRAAGLQLRAEGTHFADLTGIYADESRSVYADNCCHMNPLGNDLMTDAIGRELVRVQGEDD